MNKHIEGIVGKRISHVITSESSTYPNKQLFLVFDDDTSIELYGEDINNSKGLRNTDFSGTLECVKLNQGTITVYPTGNE